VRRGVFAETAEELGVLLAEPGVVGSQFGVGGDELANPGVLGRVTGPLVRGDALPGGGLAVAQPLDFSDEGGLAVEEGAGDAGLADHGGDGDRLAGAVHAAQRCACLVEETAVALPLGFAARYDRNASTAGTGSRSSPTTVHDTAPDPGITIC
jgi:hypothetical protein